ncbi:MAG: hypothetical protein KatS3mg002_0797 [Candidatus Woesearchaeota archaeon]|nr:MAG: hypothetical protein KatS3mg002_0797 [Candidatus Woesearchaeota archaeon]
MKLDVPLITQPVDSVDCGIAGITMIMNYYNKKFSFEYNKKHIITDAVGTYAPQLGVYLMKNGFDVTIITQHPAMFTNNDVGLNHSKLIARMDYLISKANTDQNKKVLGYFKEFLKFGGNIDVKIPDEKDIIDEIKSKRPLAALMTTNFLYGKDPLFNFHFNVITGIDESYIYVNDPLWDERGGEKKYEKKDFFYGLYASAYADLDNASLMIIKPKDL